MITNQHRARVDHVGARTQQRGQAHDLARRRRCRRKLGRRDQACRRLQRATTIAWRQYMTMPVHTDRATLEPINDEAIVRDAFQQHARNNRRHSWLTAEALLESTELTRPLLTEAIEKLEANGDIDVRWNLNGTFTARLAP